MIDPELEASKRLQLRDSAVSRWNNEGGAGPGGRTHGSAATDEPAGGPRLTKAELVQLQIRVIALERVVMALLAHPTWRSARPDR
jgi:hypothetical protein